MIREIEMMTGPARLQGKLQNKPQAGRVQMVFSIFSFELFVNAFRPPQTGHHSLQSVDVNISYS